jgi:hypothetical protein
VTGTGLDAHQPRFLAEVGRLQGRNIFEGVSGNDAVVGVGCGCQDRGIVLAVPDRVIRRIPQEVAEGLLIGRIAVFACPERTACESVVAQHVHDPDTRQRDVEQVGALVRNSADEHAAGRFTLDGKAFRRCDTCLFQKFSGSDEVVERILLFVELGGAMPGLSILATSANVCDREHSALFHPGKSHGIGR